MSIITYVVVLYAMMCIVVFVVVRAAISDRAMRSTFLFLGFFAPAFASYIVVRAFFISSEHQVSDAEREQIVRSAAEIEQDRMKRFGGKLFDFGSKVKVSYVRALNETTEKILKIA